MKKKKKSGEKGRLREIIFRDTFTPLLRIAQLHEHKWCSCNWAKNTSKAPVNFSIIARKISKTNFAQVYSSLLEETNFEKKPVKLGSSGSISRCVAIR